MSTLLNSNCSAKYLVFQWDSPGGKEARCSSFTELTYEIFINIVLDSFCGFYLFFFCLSLSAGFTTVALAVLNFCMYTRLASNSDLPASAFWELD